MPSVRLVHITNAGGFGRLQRGGAERAVEELSAAFAADPSWDVNIVAPDDFVATGAFSDAVHLHGLPLPEFSPRVALRPGSLLRQTLSAAEPDVVITHLLRGTLVGVPIARTSTRARVISILHNSLYDSIVHSDRGRLRNSLNAWSFAAVGRFADAHVAISESNAEDLVRRDRQPARNVRLIHNWVAPEFTDAALSDGNIREELNVPMDRPVILIAGRLEAQKRQDFIISLLPRLPEAELWLLGAGSAQAEYATLAERLKVADRVRFLGFRRDVPEIMATSSVVAVPSSFEGFGRVAIEALAVGTPVVVSDVAGLRDALRGAPADGGALVPADGCDAWVDALRSRLVPAPTDARSAMRRFARERYSLASQADAYRELVRELAAREPHGFPRRRRSG